MPNVNKNMCDLLDLAMVIYTQRNYYGCLNTCINNTLFSIELKQEDLCNTHCISTLESDVISLPNELKQEYTKFREIMAFGKF